MSALYLFFEQLFSPNIQTKRFSVQNWFVYTGFDHATNQVHFPLNFLTCSLNEGSENCDNCYHYSVLANQTHS